MFHVLCLLGAASRFCAVVRKTNNSYKVWNRGCEICDNELAKYRCSLEDSDTQRQELATVRHCESKIMDRGRIIADARQVLIDMPTLDAEQMREGWCRRFPRTPKTTLALASMLPDWNPRIQSLSMKFLHSKVGWWVSAMPCSFVLCFWFAAPVTGRAAA